MKAPNPSEEMYDKSMQGILKSTFSGLQRYNALSGNAGLSSFI